MKTKVTYILANIDKAIAFEWIADNINKDKFDLSFVLLSQEEPHLYRWLKEKQIECYYIPHNGKKSFPNSIIKVRKILRKIKPKVVHTHLFDANLIGLFCAKTLGIKRRVYTRHHSTFHHENFPKAIKYDRFSNYLATNIVAISENVKNVLINLEEVPQEKVTLIHHGFDLKSFEKVNSTEVEELKIKYNLTGQEGPVIGVVARFIKLKGIQHIIKAFESVLKKFPTAILVLANANGSDKEYINSLLESIPEKNIRKITFEPNLFALYKLFNLYIHVPINKEIEAFGQTYVEALASGVPSIFTLSGVANEFIINKENALVVPYKNSNEITESIFTLLGNEQLQKALVENGRKSIQQFKLVNFIEKLEKLYS